MGFKNIRYIYPYFCSMATQNETKLKTLIKSIQPGSVVLASWLEGKGISRNLLWHYLKSGWLESVGRGAYIRTGDKVNWKGGMVAMQEQAGIKVHVGALSALSLQGQSHYFRLGEEILFFFSPYKSKLPKWFENHDWQANLFHQQTSFIPENLGLINHSEGSLNIKISSPERAILECLYLAPKKLDLIECFHLMENLVNLKPKLLQELLENCDSFKVNRLFLFLAEKARHQWLDFIDTSKVKLGNGNRRITANGTYVAKYQITIPKELVEL